MGCQLSSFDKDTIKNPQIVQRAITTKRDINAVTDLPCDKTIVRTPQVVAKINRYLYSDSDREAVKKVNMSTKWNINMAPKNHHHAHSNNNHHSAITHHSAGYHHDSGSNYDGGGCHHH